MGFAGRFREGANRGEVVILAVIFGLVLRPEFLHGQNRVFGLSPAVVEITSHDLRLFSQPAGTDTEDKTTAREVIQGRDFFGQFKRIALRDQTDSRAEFNRLGHGRGSRQGHKRVGDTAVLVRDDAVFRGRIG